MQDNKMHKIVEAQFRKNWNGAHGEMADYAIKLEGTDGWVQLTQKPDTPAPAVGQEIFGHTWVQTSGDKSYLRFKKERQEGGSYQGSRGGSTQSSGLSEVMDLPYITKLLEAIAVEVGAEKAIRHKDTVIEDISDDPIDLSEIPF